MQTELLTPLVRQMRHFQHKWRQQTIVDEFSLTDFRSTLRLDFPRLQCCWGFHTHTHSQRIMSPRGKESSAARSPARRCKLFCKFLMAASCCTCGSCKRLANEKDHT
eukprot:4454386-Amphidinium_carterae.1